MKQHEDVVESVGSLLDNGEYRVGFKLSDDQVGALEALHSSPHWKVYREVLISAKTNFFNSILPKTETNDIVKAIGMVAGINFAINQLPVLVAERERKRKEELAKSNRGKNN